MAHFESLKGAQKLGFLVSLFWDSALGWLSIFFLSFALLTLGASWLGLVGSHDLNNLTVWLLGCSFSGVDWLGEWQLTFHAPEGVVVGFSLSEFTRIAKDIQSSLSVIWFTLGVNMLLAGGSATGLWWAYKRFAGIGVFGGMRSKIFLRGGIKLDEGVLGDLLQRTAQDSDLKIGNFPLLRGSENRHFMVSGDTGVGKSQAIMQLLTEIRARGERVFIYDASGDFTKHFYREGQDIMLAPFDDRSANWTPFCEGLEYHDLERIASSFAPPGLDGDKHKHWDDSANLLFTALLHAVAKDKSLPNTNESLVRAIATKTKRLFIDELGYEKAVVETMLDTLIKGTLAEGVISGESPTHKSDVIATLIPKIRSLQYLLGLEDKPAFSITNWVMDSTRDSWVFVRVNESQLQLSQALITAWVDTLVTSVLSRESDPAERIWLMMDETQGLGRINSLSIAVEKGRKYNFACVLGFTSHKKMAQIYGEKMMSNLLSSLSTKLCYRYSDPNGSEWVSKLLGEEEILEGRTSISRHREASLTEQEEKRREALVLPTEIQNLEDLRCFVKLPGTLPITSVKTQYQARACIAEYWVSRQIPDPIAVEMVVKDERGDSTPKPQKPSNARVMAPMPEVEPKPSSSKEDAPMIQEPFF